MQYFEFVYKWEQAELNSVHSSYGTRGISQILHKVCDI